MSRLVFAALCALVLAGCATRAPERPPPLTALPDVGPNFLVPAAHERMVYLARQEWSLFGSPVVVRNHTDAPTLAFPPGTPATHEVQGPMLSRVMMYWYAVSRAPIVGTQGELRPWSAAFISWLARGAGFTHDEFPDTLLHWDYIERFLATRDGAFVARDPARYAPRVGDLVCNSRGIAQSFGSLRRGAYHCDLVVGASADAVDAIGGNVGDVVAMSRLEVDANGLLRPLADRPWAAVLERRDVR